MTMAWCDIPDFQRRRSCSFVPTDFGVGSPGVLRAGDGRLATTKFLDLDLELRIDAVSVCFFAL